MRTPTLRSAAMPIQTDDRATVRRTLACAYTLLDELDRSLAPASDRATRSALALQAAEELYRLSCAVARLADPPVEALAKTG